MYSIKKTKKTKKQKKKKKKKKKKKNLPWFNYWFSFTLAHSRVAMSTRLCLSY